MIFSLISTVILIFIKVLTTKDVPDVNEINLLNANRYLPGPEQGIQHKKINVESKPRFKICGSATMQKT